jgi:PhoH-like ATPase
MFISKFENNEIHIPLIVIQELDGLKKGQDEKARNVREFSRILDKLRGKGNLSKGVDLKNGGKIFVTTLTPQDVPQGVDFHKLSNDDVIMFTAYKIDGIVISKDMNVRIKSDAWEIPAEDYKACKLEVSNMDSLQGTRIVRLTGEQVNQFRKEEFFEFVGNYPNEYYIIKEDVNDKNSALGRYSEKAGGIVSLITPDLIWGITPRNAEQRFAFDALLNDEIKLVSLLGKAGTGKTLLATAAGLCKTLEDSNYKRILISRPIVPMGKDLGYLPGDIDEKLAPWMQPIYDNLDHLFGSQQGQSNQWMQLQEQGLIKIEALTYIRGRSIPSQFLIVDEAQNLSPHEIKTIITRAGEGTKIILTGDCDQIDNPYLDSINNGLTYAVDKMKQEAIVAHVELNKGERSELADVATKLL